MKTLHILKAQALSDVELRMPVAPQRRRECPKPPSRASEHPVQLAVLIEHPPLRVE